MNLTTAQKLEVEAREKVNKLCGKYFKGPELLPMQLTKEDKKNIMAWQGVDLPEDGLGADDKVWMTNNSEDSRLVGAESVGFLSKYLKFLKDGKDKVVTDMENFIKSEIDGGYNVALGAFITSVQDVQNMAMALNGIPKKKVSLEDLEPFTILPKIEPLTMGGTEKERDIYALFMKKILTDKLFEEHDNIKFEKQRALVFETFRGSLKSMLTAAEKDAALAAQDLKGLKGDDGGVFGKYKFFPPDLVNKVVKEEESECKPNLFHSRVFKNEVRHRDVNQVRVMHWNILADGLTGKNLAFDGFSKSLQKQFASSKESLQWEFRQWLILEEIAHYEPDIITLVELDSNQDYYGRDMKKEEKDCFQEIKTLSESITYLETVPKVAVAMDWSTIENLKDNVDEMAAKAKKKKEDKNKPAVKADKAEIPEQEQQVGKNPEYVALKKRLQEIYPAKPSNLEECYASLHIQQHLHSIASKLALKQNHIYESEVDLKKNAEEKKGNASNQLQYYLEKLQYDMEYKAKGSGFAEMGTGYFWKKTKFEPVKENGRALLFKQFTDTKQIFSVMRFQQKKGELKLAVCCLHLESDKQQLGENVRAMQVWEAIELLQYGTMKKNMDQTFKAMEMNTDILNDKNLSPLANGEDIMEEYSVIITGDFNAERLVGVGSDSSKQAGSKIIKHSLIRPLAVSVPENNGFKSFYDEVGVDLSWTSQKSRPAGRTDKYTLDYVFGAEKKTKALAVLGPVDDNKVNKDMLLPNYESPSDHISLVVDFELVNRVKHRRREAEVQVAGENTVMWIASVVGAVAVVLFTMLCWMYAGPGKRRKADPSSTTSVDQLLTDL